ncbi:MAG: hypothetical protein KAT90_08425 [Gammaproteobacteria bacterium]|nr:hypothetical protein [Gammaproteobacteria bacterium]
MIVQAYTHLEKVVDPTEYMGDPSKQDQMTNAFHSVSKFYSYFNVNRIYLPETLCAPINSFIQEMHGKYAEYFMYARYKEEALNDELVDKRNKAWMKAWEYFQEVVPDAKSALENEFRHLLGDSANKSLNSDAQKSRAS